MKKLLVKIKTPDGFVIQSKSDAILYGLTGTSFPVDADNLEEVELTYDAIMNDYNKFSLIREGNNLVYMLGFPLAKRRSKANVTRQKLEKRKNSK